MAPVKTVELEVPQGSTFVYTVTYVDPDLDDAPIDITGYSARMHIRLRIADTTTIYEADSELGGDITIDPLVGKVTLKVPAAVTAQWTFKKAVFDLEIVDGSGDVTRLVKGTIVLDPEVTR